MVSQNLDFWSFKASAASSGQVEIGSNLLMDEKALAPI
jgi:hypothetical protein